MSTALSGGDGGSAWAATLSVCADGARQRGRPCDAGVCGVGQVLKSATASMVGSVTALMRAAGPRSGWGGAWDGRHLSVPVQGSPAQDACVTPSVARGLGRASDPATPASPPRRKRACHGGRSACGSGGTVKLRQSKRATSAPTATLRGFRDQPCPTSENRTRGGGTQA